MDSEFHLTASDSKEPVPERTEQKYEPSFRKVPDKVPCSFNLSNSCIQLVTQVNVSQAVLQQQRLATTGSKLSLLSKSTTINKTENEPDAKLTTADAIRRLRERGKQGPDLFPAKRLLHPGVAEENTCDAPNHSFSDRTNGYKIMRAQSVEEADKRWEEIFSSGIVKNTEDLDVKKTPNLDILREREKSLVVQSDAGMSTFSDSDSSVEFGMTAIFPSVSSDQETSDQEQRYGENPTANMPKFEDYPSSEEDSGSPPPSNTKIDGIFSRLERTFSNPDEGNSLSNNAANTSNPDSVERKQVTNVEKQHEFTSSSDTEIFTSDAPHTVDCQDMSSTSSKDSDESNHEQYDDKTPHSPLHSTIGSSSDANPKSASSISVTSLKSDQKSDIQVIKKGDCPSMGEFSSPNRSNEKSFESTNESIVNQSLPHSHSQSLDMDSKIPKLTTKLKNVYQSILHTDFSATLDNETKELSKINGIVHFETNKVEEEEKPRSDTDESYAGPLISFDRKNGHSDSTAENSVQTEFSDDSATESCQLKTDDSVQGLSINHLSLCSNKLMLHATTKTPLPAKKSYIQQVQSTGDVAQPHPAVEVEEVETDATTKDTVENDSFPSETSHICWSGVGALSDGSDKPAECTDPSFNFTLAENEITNVNEDDHHKLDNSLFESLMSQDSEKPLKDITSFIDKGLLQRQDSGSSSPAADTDDGLRRSARIRTKKNERTKTIQKNKLQVTVLEASTTEVANDHSIQSTPDGSEKCPQFIETCQSSDVSKPQPCENQRNHKTPEGKREESFQDKIRLAGGLDESPPVFEVLEENNYLTKKKKSRARKEIRRMVCDCASEDSPDMEVPCGENCLNRLLMIECSSRCHFGDSCTNKRFQLRQYAPSEVFKTEFKGWGLRAATDIEAGQLIMEYCGEVVDQHEFTLRSMKYSESNHQHFYFMALSQDEVIDATYKGNASRFINHSCNPNAETQKWTVNGRLRVGFFTLCRVSNQEEITFDYQFERYGKVAQKCFCGSTKCRGYLGKAPDDNKKTKLSKKLSSSLVYGDDVIEDASFDQSEKDKKKNKKKLTLFEDDTMEKEISRLLGGLRSSKEVLTLSRLMVRCDTHSQRSVCLQVLRETTSQTRLRTFLQFHGLPIIWSWMVDTGGIEDEEASSMKLDILNTLSILPITNRNIIEDSKVLSVVHRWSFKESGKISPADSENGIMKDTIDKVSDEDIKQEEGAPDVIQESDQNEQNADVATTEESSNVEEEAAATKKDAIPTNVDEVVKIDPPTENGLEDICEKSDVTDETTIAKIQTAAEILLDSWKDLREIYRIPKMQKPISSPHNAPTDDQESSSRDNSHSRTASPMPKRGRTDDGDSRALQREDSQERLRDGSERSWDYDRNRHRRRRSDYKDSKFSPNYYGAEDRTPDSSRRKRRFSNDSGDQSPLNRKEIPWHCRPPQGSRVSRLEHRRRFEKDVKKREQDKKRRVDETTNYTDMPAAKNLHLSAHKEQAVDGNMNVPATIPMVPTNPTFTSSGYSGNLIQINPAPQPQMLMPYVDHSMNSQMAVMPQVMNANDYVIQQNVYGMAIGGQQEYVMYAQDPNMQTAYAMDASMQNQQPITVIGQQDPSMALGYSMNPSMQSQHSINSLVHQDPSMQVGVSTGYNLEQNMQNQQPVNAFGQPMMNNQVTAMQQQNAVLQATQQQQTSNVTILGSQNGQAIVLLTQEQLQKLTQSDQPSADTAQNKQITASVSPSPSSTAESKSSKSAEPSLSASTSSDRPTDPRPPKLPPNWKTATDAEGRIYYYHAITRQTQWDQPTWGGKEEDMVGKKEAEMELSSTPTYDERKHKSSKVKTESVTEDGKKAKEVFRVKLSQFVVQCLGSFRKSDCKAGRITSTEDFKHVARKLTHNVMLKEIKQVQVLEDLDFNANVRHKTKEYVKKYMSRVGPIYRIRDDNPLDPA